MEEDLIKRQLLDEPHLKHTITAYVTPTQQFGAGYMCWWLW